MLFSALELVNWNLKAGGTHWVLPAFVLAVIVRARIHRRLSTSFRQILLHTALKILAIRKYACKFLPCLQKNLLENPHIFPMNTSSENYPSAVSSVIIATKPMAKAMVPVLECAPSDISGISSSTTT